MPNNLEIVNNNYNNIFGVKHYKVRIIKPKENPVKYVLSVMSYALFIFLLLIGGTLLVYVADIKIRSMKGDFTPPKFNAYVVLSGSMLPSIEVKDIVVTKKLEDGNLEVDDIITFISPDPRFGGVSITHRIIDKYYDEASGGYAYKTQGDNNNIADDALVPDKNVLGKVILKIPKLGYLQDLLSSKAGLIFIILIPCLTILSFDIMKMLKRITTKKKIA